MRRVTTTITKNKLGIIGVLILSTLTFSGCYKFQGDQTIPAYLTIESIDVKSYYPIEGANTQNITDAWVYIDDNLVGVFELPAVVPILERGPQNIAVRAGIKLNGISSTRVYYPFYEAINFNGYTLIEDSVQDLGSLTTTYQDNIDYGWMEDFEDSGISLDEVALSDTVIKRTSPADNPEAYLSEYSRYSGVVDVTTEKPVWSAVTIKNFDMPPQSAYVLMELDYKNDNYFNVGLLIKEYGQFVKIPLYTINHSDEWNKIYLNIGPNLALHPQADYFQIFMEAGLDNNKTSGRMYFDNIKLLYRPF